MIKFELVTLDGAKFGDMVHEVILPTPEGAIAVFEHHMPLVSLASPGIISIRRQEKDSDEHLEHYATHGGVIEIGDNSVRVLVDEADHSDEINEQEAGRAMERARELLKDAKDPISLDAAQSLIDRQAVRIKVASLRRKSRR